MSSEQSGWRQWRFGPRTWRRAAEEVRAQPSGNIDIHVTAAVILGIIGRLGLPLAKRRETAVGIISVLYRGEPGGGPPLHKESVLRDFQELIDSAARGTPVEQVAVRLRLLCTPADPADTAQAQ